MDFKTSPACASDLIREKAANQDWKARTHKDDECSDALCTFCKIPEVGTVQALQASLKRLAELTK